MNKIFNLWKIILTIILVPFLALYVYNYNYSKWQISLTKFSNELNNYNVYNIQVYDNKLIISHKSENPKYWLKFLIKHNVLLLDYKLFPDSFIATVKPEHSFKLQRVIKDEDNLTENFSEETNKQSSINSENSNNYVISYIKK